MSDGVTSQVTPAPPPAPRYVRRGKRHVAILTKLGIAAIEVLARNGAKDSEIARQIGIGRDALRAARQRDPEVDEAIARGRSVLDQEFVDRFVQWSRDGLWQPAMFFAKCRLGWREDGGNAPGVQINSTTVNIQLPAAMSDAQFRALLEPPREEIMIDADTVR